MKSILMSLYKKLNLPKEVQLFIHSFFNDQFLIGVTGVIFNDKKEILLFKHTYRQVEWSLPGGFLKGKEHPKAGLQREIEEESGFHVKIFKIIASKHDDDGARLDMSYFGKYVGGEFKPSDEVVEYGFFPKSDLPPIIDDQYKQIELAYSLYRPSFLQNIKTFFKRRVGI